MGLLESIPANLPVIIGCMFMCLMCIGIQHYIKRLLTPRQYGYFRDIVLAGAWLVLALWFGSPEARIVVSCSMLACFAGISENIYNDSRWQALYIVIGAVCAYFGPAVHFIRFPDNEYIYLSPMFSFTASTLWFAFFPFVFRYLDEIPGLTGHVLAVTFVLMLGACAVTRSGDFFMAWAGLMLVAAFWSRFGNMYRQAGKALASMWGFLVAGTAIIGQSKGIVLSTVLFLSLGLFAIPAIEIFLSFVKSILIDNPPEREGRIYMHMLDGGIEHTEAVQSLAGLCALTSLATAWQKWGIALVIIIAVIFVRHRKKKQQKAVIKNPKLWGVTFDNVSMNYALSKARGLIVNPESKSANLVVTLNAIGMETLIDDAEFAECVKESALVLADGAGLCMGLKMLGQPIHERIAGIDFAEQLCRLASSEKWPVYFVGAAGDTAKICAETLCEKYPGLIAAGARDGYFDVSDTTIPDAVAKSGAKILLAAMGQPRQEKWVMLHRERLGSVLAVGVGGAFDVFAGNLRRAPLWMQKAGLEWLYRMLQEPMRWRRNVRLITFVLRVFATKLGIHKK